MSSGPERQPVPPSRRSFLAGLLAAGSAAVGTLLAVPLVRFTLHPVLARTTEKSWSDVGSVDEFQNIDAPIKYSGDLRLATWTAWKPKSKMEYLRRSTNSSASSLAIKRNSLDTGQRREIWLPQMARPSDRTRLASRSRSG